jgi:hypothetical protein
MPAAAWLIDRFLFFRAARAAAPGAHSAAEAHTA